MEERATCNSGAAGCRPLGYGITGYNTALTQEPELNTSVMQDVILPPGRNAPQNRRAD